MRLQKGLRTASVFAAALFLGLTASGANAQITLFQSPGGIQPDENVLMDGQDPNDPTKVNAHTNQTLAGILFTSDESIFPPAQGQARVEATDGSYQTICIEIVPGMGFTELEFNVNVLNSAGDGTALIEVFGVGDVTPNTFNVDLDANGENYFGLQASPGTMMTKVCITTTDTQILDTRQWRVGGVGALVPEASTFAMFGVGLLPIAGLMFKRRRMAKQ
jgi:hypothetical protein